MGWLQLDNGEIIHTSHLDGDVFDSIEVSEDVKREADKHFEGEDELV